MEKRRINEQINGGKWDENFMQFLTAICSCESWL